MSIGRDQARPSALGSEGSKVRPSRIGDLQGAAEEALELAIQVGINQAAEQFGVNRASLYVRGSRSASDGWI